MRSLFDYFVLLLKGMAMGAADVVPGVSGGTIAFISGIYEELLETINSVNLGALKTLKKEGVKATWKSINGNFIITLFLGIGISIASLAKLISYLLEAHPILIWSFFFGLVLASIVYVGKQVKSWNVGAVISLIIGTGLAFWITVLPPMANSGELWFIFVSGMIAICAMILPGISGSFILLLMGSYKTVLEALKDKELMTIGVFMAGAVIGLLSFSSVLKWMFAKYHDLTIAILTGFLIGSLNKLWPWKDTISTRENSHGEVVPFIQENILPMDGVGNPQIINALLVCVLGAALIFGMELVSKKIKKA
nr:integral membrane protein [uncultured bacterium]